MTKRMRELQALINQKTEEAKGFLNGETKDIDKANALLDEVDGYQKEFDTLDRAEKAAKAGVPTTPIQSEQDGVKAFADAARAGFKAMNEGTGEAGGYTVPEDIRTAINHYKEERFSLANLIDTETVTTNAGRRTFKARATHAGFTEVAEGGKIGKTAAPTFEVIEYKIKKYAGYLPVTNELLADSDAAIHDTVVAWLGEEEIATENAQVLAKVNEKSATAMTSIDDIKKAVNVDLAAFAGTVGIYTNSNGLHYLDTLKDSNKRPLLSPDPAKPMEMRLSVGARSIPVTVIPNAVLPNSDAGAIPFIVGDLREYVKKFDRKQLTLTVTDTGVAGDFNAFENDMTLFRAIMRADWEIKDAAAIVRGELTAS